MQTKLNSVILACAVLLLLPACQTTPPPTPAKRDYIVTAAKPDRLFVIDAQARKVVSDFKIPDANGWLGTVVAPKDGKVAYVLVNKMESIAGIDLTTGQQVFRADLSSGNERVKSIYSINVTPDGRRLIVYELPTRLELNEYKVLEPRFRIFDTAAGVGAAPIATFPAPRRIHMILPRLDNRRFFALGVQLYEFDLTDGKLINTQGVRDWNRAGYSSPDLINFWPISEPTNIFSAPVISMRGEGADGVLRTSLMAIDLDSGSLTYTDFEDTKTLIFTTVVSPRKPDAYGVFLHLSKINTDTGTVTKRVDLPHSFYTVAMASDGSEVFTGGTTCSIGFFDPDTLAERAMLQLPGCPDQSNATMQVVRR